MLTLKQVEANEHPEVGSVIKQALRQESKVDV